MYFRFVVQDRDLRHARDMQEHSSRVTQDLESRTQHLQQQLEQAQQALHAEKAQYGHQETLLQYRSLMDVLQTDLVSERRKVKQLAGKNQEVVKAKQEALEAATAVQVLAVALQLMPISQSALLARIAAMQ